jgi:hypothetical protein
LDPRRAGWALGWILAVQFAASAAAADAERPLTPAEAREKVGQSIVVEMTVQSAKDRLDKRGEIYLDAAADFRDPQNFAIVITRTGAAALREQGIADPSTSFMSQLIRARGTVKVVQDVPRIEIEAADQIEIVKLK